MDELEENLLFKLTSIQGPLVDDESLIEVLNVTKITSEEVLCKIYTVCNVQLLCTLFHVPVHCTMYSLYIVYTLHSTQEMHATCH